MKFLFLFMDGIGLYKDDSAKNPFSIAKMPVLNKLLNGEKLVSGIAPTHNDMASLLAIDANLDVDGVPQSATGQATLVTGRNVPAEIGRHYGPKPHPPIAKIIKQGTIFSRLTEAKYKTALLNAYPQPYFDGINSGKRLYSAIPLAVTEAGLSLKTEKDYYAGNAMAADFTGEGWKQFVKDDDFIVFNPEEAGKKLAQLSLKEDFSFFEYWPSDYAGHRQNFDTSIKLMESFDGVLGGLIKNWPMDDGLILITSDHGNMENLGTRRHTNNPVPAIVIGHQSLRDQFLENLSSLVDVTPAILKHYPNAK
jgi:2,3-bisphosphoglycerate-independent phosphoglycerate mutase